MTVIEEDKNTLIKQLKREPISLAGWSAVDVDFSKTQIERIVPHREPFLLLNAIKRLNLDSKALEVETTVDANDPVFAGHFPGHPVYPGVFLIEMMGQAGLCLAYFVMNATEQIAADAQPVKGLFTRVHNAGFIQSVLPGDDLTLRVKMLEMDPFCGLVAAQTLRGDAIVSHSLLEVYFDE